MFFNDNVKRASNSISFEGLPCCFRWYKGGIYIQTASTLDAKFIGCFYDKEQALKARKMLEDVIGKNYKWKKDVDNWVEQTAPVLQQISDSL